MTNIRCVYDRVIRQSLLSISTRSLETGEEESVLMELCKAPSLAIHVMHMLLNQRAKSCYCQLKTNKFYSEPLQNYILIA